MEEEQDEQEVAVRIVYPVVFRTLPAFFTVSLPARPLVCSALGSVKRERVAGDCGCSKVIKSTTRSSADFPAC